MKKLLSVVVVFAMLAAMSVSAFAATPTTELQDNGKWITSGSDVAYAGSMMTVVAVTGEPISVSSIQYIDQTTADENGVYVFKGGDDGDGYLPKEDPTGETVYYVFVGGEKLATPIEAGTISVVEEEENDDVTVTGTVTKAGNITSATVALLNAEGENAVDPVTADATTGAFSITAPVGTYTLKITKPAHTKYTHNNVDISTLVAGTVYTLYEGDADANGIVGVNDVPVVVGDFGKAISSQTENSDINDDGIIGVNDIAFIVGNFGKVDTVLPVVPEA